MLNKSSLNAHCEKIIKRIFVLKYLLKSLIYTVNFRDFSKMAHTCFDTQCCIVFTLCFRLLLLFIETILVNELISYSCMNYLLYEFLMKWPRCQNNQTLLNKSFIEVNNNLFIILIECTPCSKTKNHLLFFYV